MEPLTGMARSRLTGPGARQRETIMSAATKPSAWRNMVTNEAEERQSRWPRVPRVQNGRGPTGQMIARAPSGSHGRVNPPPEECARGGVLLLGKMMPGSLKVLLFGWAWPNLCRGALFFWDSDLPPKMFVFSSFLFVGSPLKQQTWGKRRHMQMVGVRSLLP